LKNTSNISHYVIVEDPNAKTAIDKNQKNHLISRFLCLWLPETHAGPNFMTRPDPEKA